MRQKYSLARVLFIFLIGGLGVQAFASERTPTISVLPFADNNQAAASQSYGRVIATMFSTHLRNETNFIVLEPGVQQKARVLLSGEVSVVGSQIQIDARLVSAATGDVVVSEYAEVKSQAELRAEISKLAKAIEDKYLRQWMGDLQIIVLPTEGEVYLNEQFAGKSSLAKPLRLDNMLEGKYSLRVLAGGYQKYEQDIQVAPRTLQNVQVTLQSLPGSIRIESEPSEATVFINGQNMGKTPYSLASIAQGNYNIELQAENFKPFKKTINVQSGQLSELKAKMEVILGSLFVQSNPPNAQVFMNENFMGLAPLLLENVKPGTTPVALRLKDFSEHRENANILPGRKTEINTSMNRQTGRLTIVSSQHGLSVKIAGESETVLEAPFHKQILNAGEYKLTISKPRYHDNTYFITIKPDEEFRFETELKLKPGRISFVKADQIPTDVFINNEYKGKASGMNLEIPEGEHEILLRNWFSEKKWRVQINADETETISLQEFTQNSSFSWWGALGAVLIAIPIYFAGQR
ncbi:MAG: PEGA domain-containing protein [Fibromonadaceae bacterium]|jgi:TolB-like protein|nr:PEGA domain-containing protein [Fibromonadaceae bacterium]